MNAFQLQAHTQPRTSSTAAGGRARLAIVALCIAGILVTGLQALRATPANGDSHSQGSIHMLGPDDGAGGHATRTVPRQSNAALLAAEPGAPASVPAPRLRRTDEEQAGAEMAT